LKVTSRVSFLACSSKRWKYGIMMDIVCRPL
jgi:hypothetical protein